MIFKDHRPVPSLERGQQRVTHSQGHACAESALEVNASLNFAPWRLAGLTLDLGLLPPITPLVLPAWPSGEFLS